ncbi:MAG: hypothetical protein WC348_01975 [Patescibacteria group bacterium]|jgi:hypothetical protein
MENQPITQPVSPKKFPTIATVLISVVLTALIVGGGVYFWQAMQLQTAQENLTNAKQSLQQQIDDLTARLESPECSVAEPCLGDFVCDKGKCVAPIVDQVENWSLYKENTSVLVGVKCSNQEFNSFIDQANTGSRKTLNLNGLTLVVTPNYNNWTNEKFVGFSNDNTAFCNVGGFGPLHAYSDKLLWEGGCGGGAAPEPEEPDYTAKVAALNLCEDTLTDVALYFSTPAAPTTYTNSAYGFSLTFPASWGKIKAEQVADPGYSKIRAFRLTSENDNGRYVQINIVRIEDKNDPYVVDYPQTFIKDSNLWAFYYTSGGDYAGRPGLEDQKYEDILNEARQIIQTFTLK